MQQKSFLKILQFWVNFEKFISMTVVATNHSRSFDCAVIRLNCYLYRGKFLKEEKKIIQMKYIWCYIVYILIVK